MDREHATRRPRSTTGADLLKTFRRYGPPMILIPAVCVSVMAGLFMHTVMIRQFGTVFAGGMGGIIAESFTGSDIASDPVGAAQFEERIQQRIERGLLTAARLKNADGVVVYSPLEREIGTEMPLTADEKRALTGDVVTRVIGASELVSDEASTRNLLIIAPATLAPGSPAVGVMEVYKPYSAVEGTIRPAVFGLMGTVMLGAIIAVVLLGVLGTRAQGAIDASNETLGKLNLRLAASLNELELHQISTLQALNAAVDAKDSYTAMHSIHVADYACAICLRLGMDDCITQIERAGLLHDIGKIGVSGAILGKPTALTSDEYDVVKDHSRIGATIIETLDFLQASRPAVLHHHERWDGKGYPDGLAGEEIPVTARILAVADAFDAMTTTRPYQAARGLEPAIEQLKEGRGTQFDPAIADAFIELLREGTVTTHSPADRGL